MRADANGVIVAGGHGSTVAECASADKLRVQQDVLTESRCVVGLAAARRQSDL